MLPAMLFAQDFTSIDNSLDSISAFVIRLIPFAIGLAVLFFIWGLIKYVSAGGDSDKQKEARDTIIWGIVILFVMVSVWGLVNVLINTFGLQNDDIPPAPGIPYSGDYR